MFAETSNADNLPASYLQKIVFCMKCRNIWQHSLYFVSDSVHAEEHAAVCELKASMTHFPASLVEKLIYV